MEDAHPFEVDEDPFVMNPPNMLYICLRYVLDMSFIRLDNLDICHLNYLNSRGVFHRNMVTPVCAHARFDSMGCGYKSACCKRISRVTGHLWTSLRNSASSLQITARLGATHTTFSRARQLETGLDADQA
jgi:hypothetical protein